MQTKKVLIITYYWAPSGGAGVQRWLKMVKYLPQFGIEPIVVTVNEDKASYPVKDFSLEKEINPTLKIYRTATFEPLGIYQKISGREQIPFAGFANESKANWKHKVSRFVRGNFFIPDARRGWNKYAYEQCKQLIINENIDTVITSSPPQSTNLIGLRLKKRFNVKWIADIRDPWTDIYYYDKLLHTSVAKKLDKWYEKNVLETCDYAVVVSPFIKRMFAAKSNKIDANKIKIIPNGFDEDDFVDTIKNKNTVFTISYTGTIADDYPLKPLIAVLLRIKKEHININFVLSFTGSSTENLQHYLKEQLGTNVTFQKHINHHDSIKLLQNSDALLLSIPDVKDNEGILTGKLFEYLAACKPIICIGPKHGDAATIINDCKAGIVIENDDANVLYEYLLNTINNPISLDTINYKKYSRKQLAKTMSELINGV